MTISTPSGRKPRVRRLRPLFVLVLLLGLTAPGMAAVALELHLALEHAPAHGPVAAHDRDEDDKESGFGLIPFHGHHHDRGEPEHGHPALPTRTLRANELHAVAPVTTVPGTCLDRSDPDGVATALGAEPAPTAPGRHAPRRTPGTGPPDTLLSAFCSLLL